MFKTTQRVPFKFNKKTSHLKILHSRRDSTSMRYTMLLYYPFPKLYKINSQSLEDTQVGYISQKCTLDKNTSEKCTLKNTLPPELRNLALNLCNLAHNLRNPAHKGSHPFKKNVFLRKTFTKWRPPPPPYCICEILIQIFLP